MRPIIFNQLGASTGLALAAHRSRPRVLDGLSGTQPWLVQDADVLLTRPDPGWLTAPHTPPGAWPGQLRWVQAASAGIDFLPSWIMDGPVVTCGRGTTSSVVAEYVLGALLEHEKGLERHRLHERAAFRPGGGLPALGTLEGRVLGLAGYGSIGQAVAVRARAFGMRIVTLHRAGQGRGRGQSFERMAEDVEFVADMAALAAHSDHLVLALPLTAATRHIVDAAMLAQAKPGLHLVNVARGGLVDHPALLAALDSGQLGFASLDVTEPEPLPEGHPFYTHPKVRLTPHMSWSGGNGQALLIRKILDNLDAYADGRALHDVVDPARGY